MRVSSIVKRQFISHLKAFFCTTQADTSRVKQPLSVMRSLRHRQDKRLNSISAIFSQLPCFGVQQNLSLLRSPLASFGSNTLYSDVPVWVLRLSITNLIVMACRQSSSFSFLICNAQSSAVRFSGYVDTTPAA